MSANLTPEYLAAERDYRAAEAPADRVPALERMLAALPKHKGTEKIQADLRRRLSQARREAQKKGPAHAVPFYHVPREGAGQVALAGPPNAGKSRLVAALTHARPEVADYPFTTRRPTPGMLNFENVQIQLLDLPGISADFNEPWLPQALRAADLNVLLVDLADPAVLDETEFVREWLAQAHVPPPRLLAGNKADLPGAEENFMVLGELYGGGVRTLALSVETGLHLDAFARALFDLLGLVRVYTRAPGKHADFNAPFVLHRGQTVQDVARLVHKDFAEHLKYARLFRAAGGHTGLMVERVHAVEDGDILEFHV